MTDTQSPLPGIIEECVANFASSFAAGDPAISFPAERTDGAVDLTWDLQLEWHAIGNTYRLLLTLREGLKGTQLVVRASAESSAGKYETNIGVIQDVTEANSSAWRVALQYILEVAYKIGGLWDADDFSGDTVYNTREFRERLFSFADEEVFQKGMLQLNWKFMPNTSIPMEFIGSNCLLIREHNADLIEAYLGGVAFTKVDIVHERPEGRMKKSAMLQSLPPPLAEIFGEMMESRGGPMDIASFVARQEKVFRKRRRRRWLKLSLEIYKTIAAFLVPMLIAFFLLSFDRAELTLYQVSLIGIALFLIVARMIVELIVLRMELGELNE